MADVNMRILLSAVGGSGVTSVIGNIAKSITGGGGLGKALLGLGAAAGAAAIGLGVTAVKAAGDFQTSMTQLVTGAGESQKNLNLVSNGILNMAVATGTSTQQLSSGMYQIESAGYHGAQGLQVLQTAAQGAKVGNADLGTVANSLTTVLTDYHMNATQAAEGMNGLITTVASGKTNLQDLSKSMGTILPLASSLGVSFPQVGGAMATMTNAGTPAAQAAQDLAFTLRSLTSPSKIAQTSLKSIGLTAQQVKDEIGSHGLQMTMADIEQHINSKFPAGSVAATTAMKNIMGGASGLNTALKLGGQNWQSYENNIVNIQWAMTKGKGAVNGWSLVQGTFNQKMDKAKEVVQTLMIRIGTALLPVVSKLLDKVTPVINSFVNWLTSGNRLQNILNTVGTVIKNVTGFISGLITGIGNVISFFQKNQVAALALLIPLGVLGGYFVSLAVTAIASFIAAAPGMIAGFLSGAAGAWTMAAGVLAATWPFLAIGAAIGLVIGIIVLLVTHWSQVVSFLKGVWGAVSTWFMNSLHAVGQFFSNTWSGITKGIGNFFSGLGSIVQKGMQFIVNWFLLPFHIIGGLFNWLYQHNTYFQRLVDAIRRIITIGLNWLRGQWNRFTGWLGNLWNGLKNIATKAWNAVKDSVTSVVNTIVGWLKTAWDNELKGLGKIWDGLKGLMTKAWQAVSGVLSGAWNNFVVKPLQNLWNSIVNFANGWPKQALQWGENLIKGFINGITNMASGVGNAVKNIAGKVGSFLGFHSPAKEGPGSDADKWAPNLMSMYSKGLQAGIPQLQTSLSMVMRPVVGALTGGTLPPTAAAAPRVGSPANGPVVTINLSTMARSQSEVRNMVDLMEQELGRRMRSQTPSYNSAGIW